jgi:hypothetical protein
MGGSVFIALRAWRRERYPAPRMKFTDVLSDGVERCASRAGTCLGADMDSRAFSTGAKNDERMCA